MPIDFSKSLAQQVCLLSASLAYCLQTFASSASGGATMARGSMCTTPPRLWARQWTTRARARRNCSGATSPYASCSTYSCMPARVCGADAVVRLMAYVLIALHIMVATVRVPNSGFFRCFEHARQFAEGTFAAYINASRPPTRVARRSE
jgi:hypothetical protein